MTATTPSPTAATPTKNVFRLHGVNILNRKNVDSISRLTALEKRRATHILDERQRRDTMNQLLGELANLVRESAAEAQQQSEQQNPQKQFNADGSEKKPPVKSNSITTLRSAITEIRRLRASVGLETYTPPCAASLVTASPNASRSSSPSDVSSSQMQCQQQQLPALAPMAPQYASRNTTPMSSPKAYPCPNTPSFGHHQLQSPPLSPSSLTPQRYSSVSPPMVPENHSNQGSSLPSLFAPNSNYQSHPHQQYHPHPVSHQHQGRQQHYQPQQYNHSRYESAQSYSNPSSPSFSASMNGPSGPSMFLPQPYIEHSLVCQSSEF